MEQTGNADILTTTETDEIDQSVRSLCQQIAALRRRRNELTSRFKNIPIDVVHEIFMACHAIGTYYIAWNQTPEIIQTLRLVCVVWNDLIGSSPRLWARMCIHDPTGNKHSSFSAWITQQMSLSCNASLDLYIMYGLKKSEASQAVKDLLLPALHRWRTCIISLPYSTFQDHVADLQNPAPRLESFVFNYHSVDTVRVIGSLFDNNAPNLRHLEIPNAAIDWDSSLLRNLRTLHIPAWDGYKGPSEEQYRRLLLTCPGLEELQLYGKDDDPGHGADFRINAPLPRLKVLYLIRIPYLTSRSLLSSIQSYRCKKIVLKEQAGNPLQGLTSSVILTTLLQSTHTLKLGPPITADLELDSDAGSLIYQAADPKWAPSFITSITSISDLPTIRRVMLCEVDPLFKRANGLIPEHLFGHLSNTEKLYVRQVDVARLLGDPLQKPGEPSSLRWLLPNLVYLDMQHDYDTLLSFVRSRHEPKIPPNVTCEYPARLKSVNFRYNLQGEMKQDKKELDQKRQDTISRIVGCDDLKWFSA